MNFGKLLVAHGKLPVTHGKLPVAHGKLPGKKITDFGKIPKSFWISDQNFTLDMGHRRPGALPHHNVGVLPGHLRFSHALRCDERKKLSRHSWMVFTS